MPLRNPDSIPRWKSRKLRETDAAWLQVLELRIPQLVKRAQKEVPKPSAFDKAKDGIVRKRGVIVTAGIVLFLVAKGGLYCLECGRIQLAADVQYDDA